MKKLTGLKKSDKGQGQTALPVKRRTQRPGKYASSADSVLMCVADKQELTFKFLDFDSWLRIARLMDSQGVELYSESSVKAELSE